MNVGYIRLRLVRTTDVFLDNGSTDDNKIRKWYVECQDVGIAITSVIPIGGSFFKYRYRRSIKIRKLKTDRS